MVINWIFFILLFLLGIGILILLLLVKGLLKVLGDANAPSDTMSREEAAMIQEIYRSLERLEQRIEPLEDILFARERAGRHQD